MTDWSRRELLSLLGAGLTASELPAVAAPEATSQGGRKPVTIRTLTAGVEMSNLDDIGAVERALSRLGKARQKAKDAGFEVQTIRVTTNPVVASLDAAQRRDALQALEKLDARVASQDALFNIGPILTTDKFEPDLADFAAELARRTHTINFSVAVVSGTGGSIHRSAVKSAANVISSLSRVEASGSANFRFAAAAAIPPGTPFFPVGWHLGPDSLAIGLESAGLVQAAFTNAGSFEAAEQRLRSTLDEHLSGVEHLGQELAAADSIRYLGIDTSPAPGMNSSIGSAIEALTGRPFGHPSTLQACAAITAAVKTLKVRTCGYAGLMLPVLEDPTLAKRAGEQRYGIQELLLYSTVCGTGLDVVPLPGDIDVDDLARMIGDVATLAVRLRKPLSARLFPVPGKKSGDSVRFDDSRLTECRVFDVG